MGDKVFADVIKFRISGSSWIRVDPSQRPVSLQETEETQKAREGRGRREETTSQGMLGVLRKLENAGRTLPWSLRRDQSRV